ncbi:hypothetical protein [Malacoplasma muris]|uniref:hypothetical protein n=1 Tax=Malacoplasma muris TaxID=2119 RepID=UPI00398E7AD4
MKEEKIIDQSLDVSYNKKRISNRLVELKNKYQNLLVELNETSIDNIDRVFGYSHSDLSDIESDLFLNKINENLEVQDKIRILKNNIATKIKNIEKINSLNINNQSFDEIKNQISASLDLINNMEQNYDQKSNDFNDSTNLIIDKINSLENQIKNLTSSKNIDIKDEAIYKDEIAFLKHQIDQLLLENKECKSKLNELIYINNEKEEEISKSYDAWLKNSSKLNELENLLLKEQEEYTSLENEKDEAIDSLANKINNIRNENSIYDQFSQDIYNDSNITNSSLLEAIDQKFNDLKIELINNKFTTDSLDKVSNEINNYDKLKIKAKEIYNKTIIDLLKNLKDRYTQIINKLDQIEPLFSSEVTALISPSTSDFINPSSNIEELKNDLINVDEYVNLTFGSEVNDDHDLFSRLSKLNTLNDFKQFITYSTDKFDEFVNEIISERNILNNKVITINDKSFNVNSFFNIINDLINRINNFIALLNSEMSSINVSNILYELEDDLSQSQYWFDFVDLLNSIKLLINYQKVVFDNLETEVDIYNKLKESGSSLSEFNHQDLYDSNELINKNNKLKNIFQKLSNLEKLVDLYEMDQFETFVEKI